MTGNRLWAFGVVVGVIMIVVLGWIVGISPALSQAAQAAVQIQSVTDQNTALSATATKLQAEFATLPEMTSKLTALQAEFPDSADLDGWLSQLQGLAQSTGVTITTFTAGQAASYGGPAAAAAAAAPASPTASPSASPSPTPAPTRTPTPTPTAGAAAPVAAAAGQQPSASLAPRLFTIPVVIGITGSTDQMLAFTNASQLNARYFLATGFAVVKATPPGLATATLTGSVFVVRYAAVGALTPAG